jgi:hypothetical protein
MQNKQLPKWHTRKKKPADKPGASGLSGWFQDGFKKAIVGGIAIVITLILGGAAASVIHFSGWEGAKNFFWGEKRIIDYTFYVMSGQLLTTDRESLPGVNVVVVDHDVPSVRTNPNGFYDMRVELPVGTEQVELRFIDDNNNEVYRTMVAPQMNSLKNDETEQQFVPNYPE